MNITRHICVNTEIREFDNGNVIFYDSLSRAYAEIIEEHYIKKYSNTAFMCTPCYPWFSFEDNMITKEMLERYSQRIFCNFDQFTHEDYMLRIFDWCRQVGITNIWEWQIPILGIYPDDLKGITTFMPVRYVTKYEHLAIQPVENPEFLYVFAGNLMERRYDLMRDHMFDYLPFKIISGIRYADNINEFNNCACVLNIHSEDGACGALQEMLRLHELMCLNIPIVSEVSNINYFGNLITEINKDDIPNLYNLIVNDVITINQNPASGYKAMTYTDEAFERHRINLLQFHKVI